MVNINNRTVIEIVIAIWIMVAVGYLTHTPLSDRTHDVAGHLEYTKIIFSELRLPHPNEGWETFQPPLYYLINSLIAPPHNILEALHHIIYIRYLSIFYGLISILVIAWFLMKVDISPFFRMLILLFIVTTPKFVFLFSSYNNDSLATMLGISILAVGYKLYLNWSWKFLLVLFLLSTAAIYTKLTTLGPIAVIIGFSFFGLLVLKLPKIKLLSIIAVLILSILSLFPWLYFHNYANTGKFFTNTNSNQKNLPLKTLKKVLKIPILQWSKNEWKEPWAYPVVYEKPHRSTKSYDYLSFVFVTSVIGEHYFYSPSVTLIWLVLWIHLIVGLIAIVRIFSSETVVLPATFVILLSHLIHLVHVSSHNYPVWGSYSDYRYICWNVVAWAVLFGYALKTRYKLFLVTTSIIFLIAIPIHIYILLTVS